MPESSVRQDADQRQVGALDNDYYHHLNVLTVTL